MKLRDYQHDASDAVMREWEDNTSTLVVMPTGLGKTILFADIIRRMQPKRALVLAHREELIFQAVDKIKRVTDLDCEIEMADMRADLSDGLMLNGNVVVSSIQTQTAGGDGSGRMTRFDPASFGVLIVDEAHHATAGTYRRAIDYYRTNPDLKVLGVTATPDRADEEALGQVFDSVAYDYEILDAIEHGWLVPIEQQMVDVDGLDFSSIRTTAGDLNGADLARVMENERNLHEIAYPSLQIIGDRRAIAFCASVKQAEALAEIFNRHRTGMADWVCGKTPKEERRSLLSRFSMGMVQVVCNCGVLTEGFDDPGVECIIMGRPTKSRSLYAQMVGRSTRPLPGVVDGLGSAIDRRRAIEASDKNSCLVVDFVGNAGRHKLMTTADILGGKVSDEAVAAAVARLKREGEPRRMSDLLEEEEALAEERRKADRERRMRLTVQAKFRIRSVSPFDVLAITPDRDRGWHSGKELTEKQRNLLVKAGMDPDTMTYAQSKQMIGEMFRRWENKLCTFKQARLLRKHGYDPTNISMQEASAVISEGIRTGWQRKVTA